MRVRVTREGGRGEGCAGAAYPERVGHEQRDDGDGAHRNVLARVRSELPLCASVRALTRIATAAAVAAAQTLTVPKRA